MLASIRSANLWKSVEAVRGAGGGLGVVLDGEDGAALEAQSRIGAVEQRDVRLDHRFRRLPRSTVKPWFMETISTLPVVRSFTGVVRSVVALLHLDGPGRPRPATASAAQANAEHRRARVEGKKSFPALSRGAWSGDPHLESAMRTALRPNCECCDRDLPPDAEFASHLRMHLLPGCTRCAETRLGGVCPNCGGGFAPRPIRPAKMLARHPASTEQVTEAHNALRSLDRPDST